MPEPRADRRGGTPSRASFLLSRLNRTDLAVTAVILLIAGLFWYDTTTFTEVSAFLRQNIPPDFFPRMVLVVIIALTLLLPFETAFRNGGGEALEEHRARGIKPITYATAATITAIVLLFEVLGTVLAIYAIAVVLPLLWGERRPKILVPYVIFFPAAVLGLFVVLFQINLEPGILGITFR